VEILDVTEERNRNERSRILGCIKKRRRQREKNRRRK
jgi:hypothetical protein